MHDLNAVVITDRKGVTADNILMISVIISRIVDFPQRRTPARIFTRGASINGLIASI